MKKKWIEYLYKILAGMGIIIILAGIYIILRNFGVV